MPGTQIALGNELFDTVVYLPTVTVPNLPANSSVQQLINVPGVQVGDVIGVSQQSYVAGIAVDNVFVSTNGVVSFAWSNTTIAAVNGTAPQPFLLTIVRPDRESFGVAALPNGVY